MTTSEPANVDALIAQYLIEGVMPFGVNPKVNESPAGQTILHSPPEVHVEVMFASIGRIERFQIGAQSIFELMALKNLLSALFRKPLPLDEPALLDLLQRVGAAELTNSHFYFPKLGLLRAVEKWIAKNAMTPQLAAAINGLRPKMIRKLDNDQIECCQSIDELLGRAKPPEPVHLPPGEAWSDRAIADLADMPPEQRGAWVRLLDFARSADGSKPTKKFVAAAAEIVKEIGEKAFIETLSGWLRLLDTPRNDVLPLDTGAYSHLIPNPNLLIVDGSAVILKGLAWACASLSDEQLARAMADAATMCFKKIPAHGPRSAKVGNALLAALTLMPCAEAAAQLSRLDAQVKQPTGKKMIAKAITGVATRTGQTEEDLAELSMPTFDLGPDGSFRRELGAFTAEVAIVGSVNAELRWLKADGKVQKSIPADVKRDHADALKSLQRTVKDIEKMLPAQRVRLERLLMSERQWTYAEWRKRFIDHPLMQNLSRRLIWTFENTENSDKARRSAAGIYFDQKIVDAQHAPIKWLNDETIVKPWHPINADTNSIVAWRQWLGKHSVVQPFKQAHREIYVLTDAERATGTYSNRFAAHIVRQHQFVALCQQRGWKTGLQGVWDGGDQTPRLEMPQWGLAAEFFTEMAENASNERGEAASETGVALYLSTDQVRFMRSQGPQPRMARHALLRQMHTGAPAVQAETLALDQVPPLVFTEVMRDVDLFVGVASVGNDPTWNDGGPEGRFLGYWQSVSFGDLSESARTRHDVLEKLIPRLKIAARCTLSDKFLIVRGDLRTYKIHLGSGNILMEPNDVYLCIVPERRARENDGDVLLPFEGDSMFSVILSKAFLLAEDAKITDVTITRQIGGR